MLRSSVRIRNIFHSVPRQSTLGIGPGYCCVVLSSSPSPPPPWRQEVINLTTGATKGGHMARMCLGRQQESRDWPSQSEVDVILRGGEGAWEGGKQGILVGSLAAIFSPLGFPTSAREDVNKVSIPNSLLKHENWEIKKKQNRRIENVLYSQVEWQQRPEKLSYLSIERGGSILYYLVYTDPTRPRKLKREK